MERIKLGNPALGEGELAAVARVLSSGRLTQGVEVEAFESELASVTGRRFAVALSSGTAALHLALWAFGIGPGDDVIVPSFTFPATANAVEALGARAVLCDVSPLTWNATAETIAAAMTERTRAVIPVDIFGLPAEIAPIRALARKHGLAVIQDAACSLGGSDSGGATIGQHAELACLSFHPRKTITTGEGGAVLTDDEQLAQRLRELRCHGMRAGKFERVGLNYRLSEINAAVGRVQLTRLSEFIAERKRLALRYHEGLSALYALGVAPQIPDSGAVHPYQTFAVRLPPDLSDMSPGGIGNGWPRFTDEGFSTEQRDRIVRALGNDNIEATIATHAVHRTPAYLGRSLPTELPESDALFARGISLPLWHGLSDAAIERVAERLTLAFTEELRAGEPGDSA